MEPRGLEPNLLLKIDEFWKKVWLKTPYDEKMTKMTSHLCRSWDVFFKWPLIGRQKNCVTNCIKRCDSPKNDKFKPNCPSEEVPIWEKNWTSTNRPYLRTIFSAQCKKVAEIANMVERSSLPTMLTTKVTLLKAEVEMSVSSLPHSLTEIRQCAKVGYTLEDPSLQS